MVHQRQHRQGALRLRHLGGGRVRVEVEHGPLGPPFVRLSHSAHYDGPLAEVEFRPNPNLWVLEIAIAHPERKFGAFYEDLLLEDQSFPD